MLELTRPGGIVAMMTSPAVMDTQSNQHIRRYIAEQGEFLGAVRLPDNTFQGTGAMADIIYIRKWKDEEDAQKTRENPDYAAREQAFCLPLRPLHPTSAMVRSKGVAQCLLCEQPQEHDWRRSGR